MHLAEALLEASVSDVIVAENSPDSWLGIAPKWSSITWFFWMRWNLAQSPDRRYFWIPGKSSTRYPQISTHKISLGVLAGFVESNGVTKAWLLGVQPESLKQGEASVPRFAKR